MFLCEYTGKDIVYNCIHIFSKIKIHTFLYTEYLREEFSSETDVCLYDLVRWLQIFIT